MCLALMFSLALEDSLGSTCVLPDPGPDSVISLRIPGSFYWNDIRSQDLALDVLVTAGVPLPRPLADRISRHRFIY